MTDGKKHHKFRDLTGQTFGMLTALYQTRKDRGGNYWMFQCDCGNVRELRGYYPAQAVRAGRTPSCGCASRPGRWTHGQSKHPLYRVYWAMVQRCTNPKTASWKNYGGRGITVCEQWLASFETFLRDMEPCYQPGLTLDRIDNSQGYSPENCRWTTPAEQSLNRRTNVRVEGETVTEIAKRTGLNRQTLYYRVKAGRGADTLLLPPRKGKTYMTSSTQAPATASSS